MDGEADRGDPSVFGKSAVDCVQYGEHEWPIRSIHCLILLQEGLHEVVEVLTSFKFLTHVHIGLQNPYSERKHYNVKDIAIELRNANPCLSSIEMKVPWDRHERFTNFWGCGDVIGMY